MEGVPPALRAHLHLGILWGHRGQRRVHQLHRQDRGRGQSESVPQGEPPAVTMAGNKRRWAWGSQCWPSSWVDPRVGSSRSPLQVQKESPPLGWPVLTQQSIRLGSYKSGIFDISSSRPKKVPSTPLVDSAALTQRPFFGVPVVTWTPS